MSAALVYRARSSFRSVAAAASRGAARRCSLHQGSDTFVISLRAVTTMLPTPHTVVASPVQFQSHRYYRATAPSPKSAMPYQDDDDDDDHDATSGSTGNSTPFLLADIGEGISEVEMLQWFVSPGDTVKQFDNICEVQSDKANVEITSRFDGTVERLCGGVGDMMFVGKPLLYIATADAEGGVGGVGAAGSGSGSGTEKMTEAPAATLNNVDDEKDRLSIPSVGTNYSSYYKEEGDASGENAPSPVDQATRSSNTAKVLTSPAVRKLGKEHNLDLGAILGTGPGGRVLKADVLKIINANKGVDTSEPVATPSSTQKASPLVQPGEGDTVIPIRGYNRLMVKSMTASLQIPHMVYADEINVNALTEVRDALRPIAEDMGVPRLTYMPFFVKAASLALTKYPVLNSTIDVEEMKLTYHAGHDVGVAVDTERGLAVPVVRGCEKKSVLEIAVELGRLYSLAAEGNLSEADITKPTFTLSNIGAIGGTYMSPVVLPPQVAIGAMGKIQRLPRFINDHSDQVEAARIMPISWGGDHRAVDGATMARFSNLWKSYVENPSLMMFAMR